MSRPTHGSVPAWPTLTVTLRSDGTGELELSASSTETISAQTLDDARAAVLARVAAYANENHHRAVRLRVRDPEGEWLLGVNPDGTRFELQDDTARTSDRDLPHPEDKSLPQPGEPHDRPALKRVVVTDSDASSEPLAPPVSVTTQRVFGPVTSSGQGQQDVVGQARDVDRQALYSRSPGPMTRLVDSVSERLKDAAQREEDELDRQLARRYVVTESNLPVVVSPKGGPGKTTVAPGGDRQSQVGIRWHGEQIEPGGE